MNRIHIWIFSIVMLSSSNLTGQHLVTLQNNTALDYNFEVVQSGNIALNPSQYTVMTTLLTAYANTTDMLNFEPDTIMIPGDTVDFDGILSNAGDTLRIQMRVVMGNLGPEVFYSGSGNGFDLPWFADLDFHSSPFSMQTAPFTLKFKRITDTNDNDDDVLFAIQEDFIYSIDSTDLNDPNIINVMTYNIQMTPIVSFNFFERATYWPGHISPYQDVVVIQEIFEDATRINDLTPGMQAVGFPYFTTVLNDTALANISSPTNGGVVIYSRWPIEAEAEIKYANCENNGSFDCLASKGVKYAKINKLGKLYHIFGTHMEAGGSASDVTIRLEQYGELANFMDTLGIPEDEAVIFCGDLNTGPKDGLEYDSLRSNTNPIIPTHIGYFESTFSYADTGRIIDHVWGQADHLHPVESYNKVITFRSIDSVMWDIFDFSDHRTVLGRFVYPNIQQGAYIDTSICVGDNVLLSLNTSDSLKYQWTLNGSDITGANLNPYVLSSASIASSGAYGCEVTISRVYGDQGDVLTPIFFSQGPDTLEQTFVYSIATIDVQDSCGVSVTEIERETYIAVVPSPNDGHFEIHLGTLDKYDIFELYNGIGQLMSTISVSNLATRYNISDQPKGFYFLRATGRTESTMIKILVY